MATIWEKYNKIAKKRAVKNKVKIRIQFNGKEITLPINPENLTISKSAENEDLDIIGLGKTTRKADPGLITLSIESFFPSENSYFYTGVKPRTCIDFINKIWNTSNKKNNVAKIVTSGLLRNIVMYFVIESFEYEYRAGEEGDAYYTLEIKQYKPYGVAEIKQKKTTGKKTSRVKSTTKTTKTTTKKNTATNYYKVQKGDCLWNIAKACTGNGADWKQLYNINKKVIGSNPNLIKSGQKLILPDGWKTPKKVTKLVSTGKKVTTVSKSTVKNTGTTQSPYYFPNYGYKNVLPSASSGFGGGFSGGGGTGGGASGGGGR